MFKELFQKIFAGHSYWRMAPFAELAQVYISRFLRILSQSMVSVFVAVFLYQEGYSLSDIMLFVGGYYVLRILASYVSAYYVGWVGSKRAILTSNILAVPSLVALTMLEQHAILAAVGYFVFAALSLSLFTIASDTHFSSIKHSHVVGKELSWLHIVERVGAGVSPLAGGLLATWFGPQSIMWIAAVLMIFAALPLFITPERTRHQRVIFHGLHWRQIWRQMFSYGVSGGNQTVAETVWPLFVAVLIFGATDNTVYAKLGATLSVSLFAAIGISHLYGALIDRRRGRELFQAGVAVTALNHVLRAGVTTPLSVVLINVGTEVGGSAYSMPHVRSLYDQADTLPGYRTAYIAAMMMGFCTGAAVLAFASALFLRYFEPHHGFIYSFMAISVLSLGLLGNGFASLRKRG